MTLQVPTQLGQASVEKMPLVHPWEDRGQSIRDAARVQVCP